MHRIKARNVFIEPPEANLKHKIQEFWGTHHIKDQRGSISHGSGLLTVVTVLPSITVMTNNNVDPFLKKKSKDKRGLATVHEDMKTSICRWIWRLRVWDLVAPESKESPLQALLMLIFVFRSWSSISLDLLWCGCKTVKNIEQISFLNYCRYKLEFEQGLIIKDRHYLVM